MDDEILAIWNQFCSFWSLHLAAVRTDSVLLLLCPTCLTCPKRLARSSERLPHPCSGKLPFLSDAQAVFHSQVMECIVSGLHQTSGAPHVTRSSPIEHTAKSHLPHISRFHPYGRYIVVSDESSNWIINGGGAELLIQLLSTCQRNASEFERAVIVGRSGWEVCLVWARSALEKNGHRPGYPGVFWMGERSVPNSIKRPHEQRPRMGLWLEKRA